MKRKEYIKRTLTALCGTAPADPSTYHRVSRMADDINTLCPFESDSHA